MWRAVLYDIKESDPVFLSVSKTAVPAQSLNSGFPLHILFQFSLLRYFLLFADFYFSLYFWVYLWQSPPDFIVLRQGDRKDVQSFHPLDGTTSLFAHLSGGTLRVPFTAGWRCPPAPPTTFCKRWTKTLPFASHRDRVHAPISVSAEVRRATRFTCRLSLPF